MKRSIDEMHCCTHKSIQLFIKFCLKKHHNNYTSPLKGGEDARRTVTQLISYYIAKNFNNSPKITKDLNS